MTRIVVVLLLIISCSSSQAADCTNLTPVQCYADGLKQVQEALGKFSTLEADLKTTRGELASAQIEIAGLKQAVGGLTQKIADIEKRTTGISSDGTSLALSVSTNVRINVGRATYDFPDNGNLNIGVGNGALCLATNNKALTPSTKCF
jgi:hypothetical protein